MKILVIEDDKDTAEYVARGLRHRGYAVELAHDGCQGLLRVTSEAYDVAIIDRMLPGIDGLGVVKAARSVGVKTPILILTTLGGIDDRVEGLEAGGDDYLVKPFALAELVARVNALGRRAATSEPSQILSIGDLVLDRLKRQVTRAGVRLDLTPLEFKLLEHLMLNQGRVVTRTMLLDRVWGFHFDPKTNVVETHVSRLRAKVDKGFDFELIRTERGSGYILRASDADT
jgi:two-component system OmpR family response regulator